MPSGEVKKLFSNYSLRPLVFYANRIIDIVSQCKLWAGGLRGKGATVDPQLCKVQDEPPLNLFFYKQQKRFIFFRCVTRFWAHLLQVSKLHILTGDIEAAEQGSHNLIIIGPESDHWECLSLTN